MSFDLERDHVGPGWQTLIAVLHTELSRLDPEYQIAQIKEKFGALRYYFSFSEAAEPETRQKMDKLVEEAEQKSQTICEWCGQPGKNEASHGWWTTLCENCRATREKVREERFKQIADKT